MDMRFETLNVRSL